MNTVAYIIVIISNLSALPAIWVGRKDRYILWYYALACFVADLTSFSLKQIHIPHVAVSNLFFITEFILITSYFKNVFLGKKYQQLIIVIQAIIAALFLYNSYTITAVDGDTSKNYNYAFTSVFFVIYIIFSLGGLFKIMKEANVAKIEQSPLFLSCIAFLLYASGALLIFLAKDEIVRIDKQFYSIIWPFFFMPLNITKNILVAFSLRYSTLKNA